MILWAPWYLYYVFYDMHAHTILPYYYFYALFLPQVILAMQTIAKEMFPENEWVSHITIYFVKFSGFYLALFGIVMVGGQIVIGTLAGTLLYFIVGLFGMTPGALLAFFYILSFS